MIRGDYRVNFAPDTAERRLRFWQALDMALDAADVIQSLGGGEGGRRDDVRMAFESVMHANIRLARAQLRRAAEQDVTS